MKLNENSLVVDIKKKLRELGLSYQGTKASALSDWKRISRKKKRIPSKQKFGNILRHQPKLKKQKLSVR